jgi:hypothetical protein
MFKKYFPLIILLLISSHAVAADDLLNKESIGDFRLGLTEKDLQGKIPCPLTRGEEELWGADGIYHQTWDYPKCGLSFTMSSAQKGETKTLDAITVSAPSTLKTKRGIHIGSSIQDVEKAYKKEKDKEASVPKQTFVAGSLYGGLVFNFEHNKVSSIFLGAGAE